MEILVNKVSFAVKSTSDAVSSIGNATFPQGTTVSSLATSNPQYFIDYDTNGNAHLSTVKAVGNSLSGNFSDGNGGIPYTLKAVNYEVVDFFGGHPKERPHAY